MKMLRGWVFLCSLMLIFMSGCTLAGGKKIDTALIPKIEKGKTTKHQILEMFGNPASTSSDLNNEEVWGYFYMENELNFAQTIPILGVFAERGGQKAETLSIVFNDKGIVKDVKYGKQSMGGGNVSVH